MKFKDNGFSEKQLEQLGQLMDRKLTYALIPIVKDIKDIKSRLDVLENKVDLMIETPTMKKELSTLPKNKK